MSSVRGAGRPRRLHAVGLAAACVLGISSANCAGETELVSGKTPWRVFLTHGPQIARSEGGALKMGGVKGAVEPAKVDAAAVGFTPLPPANWTAPDFDDTRWARMIPADLVDRWGGYGAYRSDARASMPALLCLRTRFGVSDAQAADDLKVAVTCLGGAVVHVNGREVGRAFLPAGRLQTLTPADDYPIEAYTMADGITPLPMPGKDMEDALLARYRSRVRTFTVAVPAAALVKGANVLGVEMHASAVAGPLARGVMWRHLGLHGMTLTSASGKGCVPYEQALKGTRAWSAGALEQVSERFDEQYLTADRSFFKTLVWGRAMALNGLWQANPFEAVRPVRMAMPRNGVGSGQAVLSDVDGLRNVTASLAPLKGPGGAVLPAAGVEIRYACRPSGLPNYCDVLEERPPEGVTSAPVWLIVKAPKDQPPGWYVSSLTLGANGKTFDVPVQALVTGYVLPDSRELTSDLAMCQSPESVARQYNVALWSDEHFKRLDRAYELLGQLGNDVLYIPVNLTGLGGKDISRWEPIVRWVQDGDSLKLDLSVMERVLDVYSRRCAPPKAISLGVWGMNSARNMGFVWDAHRKDSIANPKAVAPTQVRVWNAATGTAEAKTVPEFGAGGENEAFWKPVVEAVRAAVVRRGWSERTILLGLGGDYRPDVETVEAVKRWAPYARWHYLSHFSGDPRPMSGKMLGLYKEEIGIREWPWVGCSFFTYAPTIEKMQTDPPEFLEMPTDRWMHQADSPPAIFRTMTGKFGNIGRVGLDFWFAGKSGPRSSSYFSHLNWIVVPGAEGHTSTVRFQMLREGVQDAEIRLEIVRRYMKQPEAERKVYRDLIDEMPRRLRWGLPYYVGQAELSWDWEEYFARLQETAAGLAGVEVGDRWSKPPASGK